MDYVSDILARLQKGEKVEDIASQLTKSINDANDQFKKVQEQARARTEKHSAVEYLLDSITSVLRVYGVDDALIQEFDKLDVGDIVELLDEVIPLAQEYMNLMEALRQPRSATATVKPAPNPIEDFLNREVRSK